jgi:putative membrane protein
MKATIFSSFVVCASVALFSCQGTSSENNDNRDTMGAINSSADTAAAATTDQGATTTLDENAREFMNKAAIAGITEVHMGELGSQKATNARVKSFGEMMVKDHTAANNDLKALASQKNLTLPTAMDEAHQKDMDDLNKKTGADWDKAYMKQMVDAHEKVIRNFEDASKNANDPDVKNFATQKLPTLRTHLDSAREIHKALK